MRVIIVICMGIGMLMHSAQGSGKVLKSGCVSFLNESLENKPTDTARLLMAYKRIIQISKELEKPAQQATLIPNKIEGVSGQQQVQIQANGITKQEEVMTVIANKIAYMLEPIKEFLAEVKEHHWEVRTILVESLEVPFKGNLDIISLTMQEDQLSYILRYLNNKENDVIVFLTEAVKDESSLKKLCSELKTFIGDLQESFSSAVKKRYVDFVNQIKMKKENKEEFFIEKEESFIEVDTLCKNDEKAN